MSSVLKHVRCSCEPHAATIMKMQTTNFNIVLCSAQEGFDLYLYTEMQSIRLNEQRFFAVDVTQVLADGGDGEFYFAFPLTLLIFATFYYFTCK